MDSERPLEILPFGRTLEQEGKLARRKEGGRRGLGLLLAFALAIVGILIYAAGFGQGRLEVTSNPAPKR